MDSILQALIDKYKDQAKISKLVNANEVFEALAKGYSKYSNLLSQSHVSSGPTLIDILDLLMKMEAVIKVALINLGDSFQLQSHTFCFTLNS